MSTTHELWGILRLSHWQTPGQVDEDECAHNGPTNININVIINNHTRAADRWKIVVGWHAEKWHPRHHSSSTMRLPYVPMYAMHIIAARKTVRHCRSPTLAK
jgi:hypothetical protein